MPFFVVFYADSRISAATDADADGGDLPEGEGGDMVEPSPPKSGRKSGRKTKKKGRSKGAEEDEDTLGKCLAVPDGTRHKTAVQYCAVL